MGQHNMEILFGQQLKTQNVTPRNTQLLCLFRFRHGFMAWFNTLIVFLKDRKYRSYWPKTTFCIAKMVHVLCNFDNWL